MRLIKRGAVFVGLLFSIFSCKPEEIQDCAPTNLETGLYVLNEGLFQQNNSSIDFRDESTGLVTSEIFKAINERGIGDTGNDMIVYGSKMYCVVNVSGQVEVFNKSTARSIAQIPLQVSGSSKQPRSIVAYQSSVWVTSFDGTIVEIDTNSLSIISELQVGKNPEGIAVLNDQLFVANSGGLDAPNYDSTISVIDLNTNNITETVVVRVNPSKVIASDNSVFCISNGNYGSIPSLLQRINPTTFTVEDELEIYPSDMNYHQGKLYVLYKGTENGASKIGVMNPETMVFENVNLISNSEIVTFYGFDIDEQGRIHCRDANGYVNSGKVYTYSLDGQLLFDFQVGLNPNKVVLINN
jgi:hypothetical protein